MVIYSEEFIGSAYDGKLIATGGYNEVYCIQDFRIGNVPAVPGEQKVYAMARSQGDMTRVGVGLFWNDTGRNNGIRQAEGLSVESKERDVNQCSEPFLSRLAITRAASS
jgi:hypothetical protein